MIRLKIKKDKLFAIALLAPVLITLILIVIFPLIFSIMISFKKYDFRIQLAEGEDYPFVGIDNYMRAFSDSRLIASFYRTVFYIVTGITTQLLAGMGIALLLSKISWRKYVIPIIVLPSLIPPTVVGHMGRIILNPEGPINYFLNLLGLGKEYLWHTSPKSALFTIVIVDTWQWTPFVALFILAGLLTIPKELIESAMLDGASRLKIFFYIVIPLIKNVLAVVLIFRVLEMLRVFDIIYVMTFGGPGSSTELVNFYAYLTGFRYWDLGYSSAIGWILVAILTIGIVAYLRLLKVG